MVPCWKMNDLGGVGVPELPGGLAGWQASLKMLEPKDPIRPRWGVKKRKRFWLPPKKDLLSVGWSFRISSSTGEVKVQFQREKEGPDTVSEHHRCPKSSIGRALKFLHIPYRKFWCAAN